MKLARKLTVALVAGVLAVMAVYGWVEVGRETAIIDGDLAKNTKYGRGAAEALKRVWAREGEAGLREVLALIDEHGPDVVQLRFHHLADLEEHPPPSVTREALSGLEQQNVITLRQTTEGEWVRRIFVPISIPDHPPGVVEVIESLQAEHTYVDMNRRDIIAATVLVALVCGLIAMGLGYWFVGRPMARLRDHARAIGSGDLNARVGVRQHDEIGDLAGEINVMSDRLAAARDRLAAETEARIATLDQLRHTDRLTTVGRLAAGVAHELGTPLNVIANRAGKIAATEGVTGNVVEYARVIQDQSARMVTVIRQLLDFSRRQGPKLGVVNLRTLTVRTIDLLQPFAHKRGVTIELTALDGEWFARIDQNQVQQALTNVMMNGIEAMPNGGHLRVSVGSEDAGGGSMPRRIRIRMEDEGTGIAAADLAHVFEPFFTTKGVGEGTGLGLSVAHGIVADHGGSIDVQSEVGKGTAVTIQLAAAEPGSVEAAS
jgi:two-component system NtrC family sensor kinase